MKNDISQSDSMSELHPSPHPPSSHKKVPLSSRYLYSSTRNLQNHNRAKKFHIE